MTDIHDRRPDHVLLEYKNHRETAKRIRAAIEARRAPCGGILADGTDCPRSGLCERFRASLELSDAPWQLNGLCSQDDYRMQISIEEE